MTSLIPRKHLFYIAPPSSLHHNGNDGGDPALEPIAEDERSICDDVTNDVIQTRRRRSISAPNIAIRHCSSSSSEGFPGETRRLGRSYWTRYFRFEDHVHSWVYNIGYFTTVALDLDSYVLALVDFSLHAQLFLTAWAILENSFKYHSKIGCSHLLHTHKLFLLLNHRYHHFHWHCKLHHWLNSNKLFLNPSKSDFLSITKNTSFLILQVYNIISSKISSQSWHNLWSWHVILNSNQHCTYQSLLFSSETWVEFAMTS